ncbi:MAG: hypothetical protein Q4C95_12685 [Planctomycetia bacterium]|nr:hypothetical protein [Planctomycetia bacterium]
MKENSLFSEKLRKIVSDKNLLSQLESYVLGIFAALDSQEEKEREKKYSLSALVKTFY